MGRSKWRKDQKQVVGKAMRRASRLTAAEVYSALEKAGVIRNLTIGNVRDFLDREYHRAGKKRCGVSWRKVICWSIRQEPKDPEPRLWVHHVAKKYD